MRYSENEIIKALTIIKNICEDYAGCTGCPFETPIGDCQINVDSPEDWNIINSDNAVWRAFTY